MPIHETHDRDPSPAPDAGAARHRTQQDAFGPDASLLGRSPVALSAQLLRYLQRTAGNAGVADLLAARRPALAPRPAADRVGPVEGYSRTAPPATAMLAAAPLATASPTTRARSGDRPRSLSVTLPAQRHAPGDSPSIDKQAVAAELSGKAAPPRPGAAPAPAAAGPTPTPAGGGPGAAGGGPAPAAPVSDKAMDYASAEAAVSAAYGKVKKITPAPIKIVSKKELLEAYDNDCIKRGVKFTEADGTQRPWKKGDVSSNIEGFAMVDGSAIYVQKDTVLPTATAHELLHVNTAADFRKMVGEAINEGTTEHLAIKAVRAAGLPTAGSTGAKAYPQQVGAVGKLIKVVGEAALIEAYFNGAESLVRAYEAIMPHTFAELKGTGSLSVTHMAALLVPRTPTQKAAIVAGRLALAPFLRTTDVAIINAVLDSDPSDVGTIKGTVGPMVEFAMRMVAIGRPIDVVQALAASPVVDPDTLRPTVAPLVTKRAHGYLEGWVSDGDLDNIETLYNLRIADKDAMRAELRPRAKELWSIGQRARLRMIVSR